MTEQPTVAGDEASPPESDADLVLGSLLLMVVTALLVAALDSELQKNAQAPPAVTPTPAQETLAAPADASSPAAVAAGRWRRLGARLARRLRLAHAARLRHDAPA